MSRNSARLGTAAATWTWPPSRSWRSNRVTRWPRSAAVTAACSPPGPAADHHHPPAPGGGGEDGRLASGPRVLDAAQPPVEAHPADALLVAGQAGADVGGMAGPGLGREVGVGDLAAHHPDQVAQPVVEGPIGLERVLEPAHARPPGRPPPSRMALGMNMAYPGGTCMLASIMYRVAVATPIEVLM